MNGICLQIAEKNNNTQSRIAYPTNIQLALSRVRAK